MFYLQLLLFAGLAFFVMLPWMKRTLTITLDADWLYRRAMPATGKWLWWAVGSLYRLGMQQLHTGLSWAGDQIDILCRPGGLLTRTWMVSTTAAWIVALLSYYLIIYFF